MPSAYSPSTFFDKCCLQLSNSLTTSNASKWELIKPNSQLLDINMLMSHIWRTHAKDMATYFTRFECDVILRRKSFLEIFTIEEYVKKEIISKNKFFHYLKVKTKLIKYDNRCSYFSTQQIRFFFFNIVF